MRNLFLTMLLIASATGLYAQDAIVKVESFYCDRPNHKFKGSGVLFEKDGDIYALTSEHVVFHGNDKICHQVKAGRSETISSNLILASWGKGLALLKLNDSPSFHVPAFNDLFSNSEINATKLKIAGYPQKSQTLLSDSKIEVLTTKSSRHYFSEISTGLIEIKGHGEKGMSGGALLEDSSDVVLKGILSHQYLKIEKAGKKAKIKSSLEEQDSIQNHLIVIPASVARDWLQEVFVGKYKINFYRNPLDQFYGLYVIHYKGLQFELEFPDLSVSQESGLSGNGKVDTKLEGEKTPSNGSALGKGGVDLDGIGGEDEEEQNFSLQIKVKKSNYNGFSNINEEEWVKKLSRIIINEGQANIPFMVKGLESKIGIKSLEMFFSELSEDSSLRPIIFVPKLKESSLNRKTINSITDDVIISKDFIKKNLSLDKSLSSIDKKKIERLIDELELYIDYLKSEDYFYITDDKIREFIDNNEGWTNLLAGNVNDDLNKNALSLLAKLYKLIEAID